MGGGGGGGGGGACIKILLKRDGLAFQPMERHYFDCGSCSFYYFKLIVPTLVAWNA